MKSTILVLFASLGFQTNAHAWSEHHRITRQAVSTIPGMTERWVTPRPFAEVTADLPKLVAGLAGLGFARGRTLTETIHIRLEYDFPFAMGEAVGVPVSLVDVLAKYSDEPDWRMDQELFGDDQYPELWKSEFALMGGKQGVPSQAFRHMYWPPFSISHPNLASLHLPPNKIASPMGEAALRAAVFVELARAAHGLGQDYWSARFVANALHYLEDSSQPFHTAQVPYYLYALLPEIDFVHGAGIGTFKPQVLIAEVTHIISYYHFAYEDFVGRQMTDKPAVPAVAAEFFAALVVPPRAGAVRLKNRDAALLVQDMAKAGNQRALGAGRAAFEFFPEIEAKFATMNPSAMQNDAWWSDVDLAAQATEETGASRELLEARQAYFDSVTTMFSLLGEAVRDVVRAETDF